jgi:hypothetical protein
VGNRWVPVCWVRTRFTTTEAEVKFRSVLLTLTPVLPQCDSYTAPVLRSLHFPIIMPSKAPVTCKALRLQQVRLRLEVSRQLIRRFYENRAIWLVIQILPVTILYKPKGSYTAHHYQSFQIYDLQDVLVEFKLLKTPSTWNEHWSRGAR